MEDLLDEAIRFLYLTLESRLFIPFKRITLVGKNNPERLTIDLDLCFFHEERVLLLGRVAITEIKQGLYSRGSTFTSAMRSLDIRQSGFSKYCFGVSRFFPQVKKNPRRKNFEKGKTMQETGPDNPEQGTALVLRIEPAG